MITKLKSPLSDRLHQTPPKQDKNSYPNFNKINGNHSFKAAVPDGYVDYAVRKRHGGKVAFFNFDLAKEMGLIPQNHPHELTPALRNAILETFALVIINEWDIEHNIKFPAKDIKPNRYMATRYLQLQHPSRRGTTSGDGRGIWNGEIRHRGVTWDVTSSGTGATRLSPAVAIEQKFFRTGDPKVCYGDGYNTVRDGFHTALMSEIFHRNGIPTERTLTLIEFEKGTSVNVRAGQSLLRPSHFFNHLKQANYPSLKGAIDYFIDRLSSNHSRDKQDINTALSSANPKQRYAEFTKQMALSFSKLVAQFETEYIFCWLDWDGDNVLANAGIIDYGSIRQFGLFHYEYRYDDVDRYSTKITEQRLKARYLVQTFAQIRNYLTTGKKKNIKNFQNDPVLKIFDENFTYWMDLLLLKKMGFNQKQATTLMSKSRAAVNRFRQSFAYFERTQSTRGIYAVSDGVTSNAVFCMRDALRELPQYYLKQGTTQGLEPEAFIAMIRSSYARKKDLVLSPYRVGRIKEFHSLYLNLVNKAAGSSASRNQRRVLSAMAMRSSVLNRHDRITGDGIVHATETLLLHRRRCSQSELQDLVEQFVHHQVWMPLKKKNSVPSVKKNVRLLCEKMQNEIKYYSDGI